MSIINTNNSSQANLASTLAKSAASTSNREASEFASMLSTSANKAMEKREGDEASEAAREKRQQLMRRRKETIKRNDVKRDHHTGTKQTAKSDKGSEAEKAKGEELKFEAEDFNDLVQDSLKDIEAETIEFEETLEEEEVVDEEVLGEEISDETVEEAASEDEVQDDMDLEEEMEEDFQEDMMRDLSSEDASMKSEDSQAEADLDIDMKHRYDQESLSDLKDEEEQGQGQQQEKNQTQEDRVEQLKQQAEAHYGKDGVWRREDRESDQEGSAEDELVLEEVLEDSKAEEQDALELAEESQEDILVATSEDMENHDKSDDLKQMRALTGDQSNKVVGRQQGDGQQRDQQRQQDSEAQEEELTVESIEKAQMEEESREIDFDAELEGMLSGGVADDFESQASRDDARFTKGSMNEPSNRVVGREQSGGRQQQGQQEKDQKSVEVEEDAPTGKSLNGAVGEEEVIISTLKDDGDMDADLDAELESMLANEDMKSELESTEEDTDLDLEAELDQFGEELTASLEGDGVEVQSMGDAQLNSLRNHKAESQKDSVLSNMDNYYTKMIRTMVDKLYVGRGMNPNSSTMLLTLKDSVFPDTHIKMTMNNGSLEVMIMTSSETYSQMLAGQEKLKKMLEKVMNGKEFTVRIVQTAGKPPGNFETDHMDDDQGSGE